MVLIVWLGNPGSQYANTRHNVGFLFADYLASCLNASYFQDSKHKWLIAEARIGTEKALIAKPMTYMNLSGECVGSIARFYKIPPDRVFVVSDDIDMEFGKVRYRAKGSSGGQNGIKSIIEHLGTDAFHRIKIGIGRHPKFEVSDWVLSAFKKEEHEALLDDVFLTAREELEKRVGELA